MSRAATAPLAAAEIAGIFGHCGHFAKRNRVVLAVSGGADSTALMHLAVDWRAGRGHVAPEFSVVTVDHGLRPASTVEAQAVAAAAKRLGLDHTILAWTGEKPATGVQAAARQARYDLIERHLRATGISAVATAHTRDDQAETLLMRLARGSGVHGLAAMQPCGLLKEGPCVILRPLLDVPKSRLVATLQARGIGWTEDPSNQQPEFERVRWRHAAGRLRDLGLTADSLGLSARRLARARRAIDATATQFGHARNGGLRIDDLGYAEVDWPRLLAIPEEVRLQILARLIKAVGGLGGLPPLSGLEAMTEARGWQAPIGRTLARVVFRAGREGRVLLLRETGRAAPAALTLTPGQIATFDGRFTVATMPSAPAAFDVASLGAGGRQLLAAAGIARPAAPAAAIWTLPAFWRAGRLIAVPAFSYCATGYAAADFTAEFANRPFES